MCEYFALLELLLTGLRGAAPQSDEGLNGDLCNKLPITIIESVLNY